MSESESCVNSSLSKAIYRGKGSLHGGRASGPSGTGMRILAGVLLAAIVTLVLLGAGALAWQHHYSGRVVPGVWVAGIPLEGLTAPEAEAALRQAWGVMGPRHLTLRDGERQWVVPLDELGISWDVAGTVRSVMTVGHTGSFFHDWYTRLAGLQRGVVVPALWSLEEGQANLTLHKLAAEIDQPARSATLDVDGAAPRSELGAYGRELDVDATREQLRMALRTSGLPEVLDLTVRSVAPTVVDGEAARARAEQILSRQVNVVMDDGGTRRSWALAPEVIRRALTTRQEVGEDGLARWAVDLDPAPVAEWVTAIAKQIDQPVIEGRVRIDPNTLRASIVTPSQPGREVNTEEALQRVLAALEGGEETVELAVNVTEPYVTEAQVASWGELNLLSEGVSYFRGSDPGRKQNITVGSSRYEGIVIPPGATFSFNEHVGPVTAAEGWAEAYVIVGDRTELGAGGGICQVSTTVFRAAFFAGLPIVERYPHTYRVSWYEPPVGLDATVFTPWVDFKFRNDLDFPIIIDPDPDMASATLTFRFYGPGTLGYTVEMEGPEVSQVVKAPPPIYEDDPSLEPGEIKQVDSAHDGLRAVVYRVIKQGDEVISREEFVSDYAAWPARFKRGPAAE